MYRDLPIINADFPVCYVSHCQRVPVDFIMAFLEEEQPVARRAQAGDGNYNFDIERLVLNLFHML